MRFREVYCSSVFSYPGACVPEPGSSLHYILLPSVNCVVKGRVGNWPCEACLGTLLAAAVSLGPSAGTEKQDVSAGEFLLGAHARV